VRLYTDDTRFWITESGLLALLEAELYEQPCSHTWEIVQRGTLQCIACKTIKRMDRTNGTSYRNKRRND
jgi:hypothetical protein